MTPWNDAKLALTGLYLDQGRPAKAAELCNQELLIAGDDHQRIAEIKTQLGLCALMSGNYFAGEICFGNVVTLGRQQELPLTIAATAICHLARIHTLKGYNTSAAPMFQHSLELFSRANSREGQALCRSIWAWAEVHNKSLDLEKSAVEYATVGLEDLGYRDDLSGESFKGLAESPLAVHLINLLITRAFALASYAHGLSTFKDQARPAADRAIDDLNMAQRLIEQGPSDRYLWQAVQIEFLMAYAMRGTGQKLEPMNNWAQAHWRLSCSKIEGEARRQLQRELCCNRIYAFLLER